MEDIKDFEESERLAKLIDAQFEAKRKVDPNHQFSDEEIAQMIDDAKALGGFDTSKKTDPSEHAMPDEEFLKLTRDLGISLQKDS